MGNNDNNRRRVTRYNENIGPDFSSGMVVLTIFLAAVVLLCVYFVCNADIGDTPETEQSDTASTGDTDKIPGGDISGTDSTPEDTAGPSEYTVSVSDSELHRGFLILVNGEYDYVFGDEKIVFLYGSEKKSSAYGLATVNISCAESVLPYFNSMLEDYVAASGDDGMVINSGHRTYDDQDQILQARIERVGEEEALAYVALPGKSEHHTGYALDIASHGENNNPDWLPDNCRKYGFIQRYQRSKEEITGIAYEYWHYRYVGEPHAEIMSASDLCMEEYITMLSEFSYTRPLEYKTEDGDEYMIYYAACENDGETDITGPAGYEYTISGNNVDGFIVTVTLSLGEDGGTDSDTGADSGANT